MAIAIDPSQTPVSSAARATAVSSATARHTAVWSPGGPTGTAAVPSSTRRPTRRVASIVGTGSMSGASMRNVASPSAVLATTRTHGAPGPSRTTGFSPVSVQRAPARRARVRTLATGSPPPLSSSATVPAGRVGGAQRGEVRTGERDAPHLLEHHDGVDQPETETAEPLLHEHAGP